MMYWFLGATVILLFGLVAFRGAPYVPTHRRQVKKALDMFNLKSNDLFVDLGSGDGNMLKAAAKRGYRAIGYEINPILCVVSWLRCLPYHNLVSVRIRDFWFTDFPPETKAVFIFLAGPYMKHLSNKLEAEMAKRKKPLKVISYGFPIPGFAPKNYQESLYLYELQPNAKKDMALQIAS